LSANQIALANLLARFQAIPVEELIFIGQVTIGEAWLVKHSAQLTDCYIGMSVGALFRSEDFTSPVVPMADLMARGSSLPWKNPGC
jgi:hypothetical protein